MTAKADWRRLTGEGAAPPNPRSGLRRAGPSGGPEAVRVVAPAAARGQTARRRGSLPMARTGQ